MVWSLGLRRTFQVRERAHENVRLPSNGGATKTRYWSCHVTQWRNGEVTWSLWGFHVQGTSVFSHWSVFEYKCRAMAIYLMPMLYKQFTFRLCCCRWIIHIDTEPFRQIIVCVSSLDESSITVFFGGHPSDYKQTDMRYFLRCKFNLDLHNLHYKLILLSIIIFIHVFQPISCCTLSWMSSCIVMKRTAHFSVVLTLSVPAINKSWIARWSWLSVIVKHHYFKHYVKHVCFRILKSRMTVTSLKKLAVRIIIMKELVLMLCIRDNV